MAYFGLIILLSSIGFLSACDFVVKVKQELRQEGFHRNLTYTIEFTGLPDNILLNLNNCTIGIHQLLPAGIFANPDELDDLRRSHRLSAITKRTNIELPKELSEPSIVFVTTNIAGPEVEMWLPLHARYHKPVDFGSYATNEIIAPYMFMTCPDTRLEHCSTLKSTSFACSAGAKTNCNWKAISFDLTTTSPIEWPVPVGNLQHYFQVAVVTTLAVTILSMHLMYTLHVSKNVPYF